MMNNRKLHTDNRRSEEIAVNRHKILAPVLIALEEKQDAAKIAQLKKEICATSGVSSRTLRRWLAAYRTNGFEGLKPVPKNNWHGADGVASASGLMASKVIPEELIEEAILLRREVPSRSIPAIIDILEMEGRASPGFLKRTTLQDHLMRRGYSSRHMRMYQSKGMVARRFARLERNDMWQSDIKYGPYINIKGNKKQIYMVCFLDDATRYVVHGEFYDELSAATVEDCFRKAIIKEGLPERVYFDNGTQYRTKWMERACAMMDIKLLFARPYSPESTGKIERFNRTVESFLDEVALKDCRSLEDFNHYFKVWLQEAYHSRPHAGLNDSTKNNITPEIAYKTSKAPLRFLPADTIALAFTRFEARKVDKVGCISFDNQKYEVGVALAGQKVNVLYDPADISTLIVEHLPSRASLKVERLRIGPHSRPRPKLPRGMLPAVPHTSRLLDAKEKRYNEHQGKVRRAISFKDIDSGDQDNVNNGSQRNTNSNSQGGES